MSIHGWPNDFCDARILQNAMMQQNPSESENDPLSAYRRIHAANTTEAKALEPDFWVLDDDDAGPAAEATDVHEADETSESVVNDPLEAEMVSYETDQHVIEDALGHDDIEPTAESTAPEDAQSGHYAETVADFAPYSPGRLPTEDLAMPEVQPAPEEPPHQVADLGNIRSHPALDDIGDLDEDDFWDDSDFTAEAEIPTAHDIDQPLDTPKDAIGEKPGGMTFAWQDEGEKPRLRREWNSKNELMAIICLIIALLGAGAFFMMNAFRDLPRDRDPFALPSMPVNGNHLKITAIKSYWRVPQTADTVQRGVELIPVIELQVAGNGSYLRVQFYNSQGQAVGDPITERVDGNKELMIPSTAGFESANLEHAYRTGLLEPWTVDILEAPAGTSPSGEFQRLANLSIAKERK